MALPKEARRLVVNADDFGRSHSINAAVDRAQREGILTTASLMVNEVATEEAVQLARANPGLGVGLHLTLVCGHSALTAAEHGVEFLSKLSRDCGVPQKLSALNIPRAAIPGMAKAAMQVQRLLKNNLRTVTEADAVKIYEASF